ncbi:hypothetical protein P7H74_13885 [Enterococcus devriesei]|uniref:hypothetical protein n=1 Tax=Enterococcus devriesei TaxID=319970 RepID=UPI00288E4D5B|nr:hypothetical protein [Enterococcus devriesei]MDT2822840.1 hypothetical protein [Enterococcus devriesei]
MVTYDEAYSVKENKYVTAKCANEHYTSKGWDGQQETKLFTHNNEFQCADNCDLVLTCVNIHVDFSDSNNYKNKRQPYFCNKSEGKHSTNCNRVIKARQKRASEKSQTTYYTQDGNKFIFSFKKGLGLPQRNSPSTSSILSSHRGTSGSRTQQSKNKTQLPEERQIPHVTSIKRMINLFEEFEAGDPSIKLLDSNYFPMSFYDLFTPINGRPIDNLYTIYYGQAHTEMKTTPDGKEAIRLKFTKKTSIPEINRYDYPSVLLYENEFIDNRKKTLYKTFKDYAKKWSADKKSRDSYFRLYYVGTFEENKSYINFDSKANNIPKSLFFLEN